MIKLKIIIFLVLLLLVVSKFCSSDPCSQQLTSFAAEQRITLYTVNIDDSAIFSSRDQSNLNDIARKPQQDSSELTNAVYQAKSPFPDIESYHSDTLSILGQSFRSLFLLNNHLII
jgi:hypothetical protein